MIEKICEELDLDEKDLLIKNLQQRIDKAIELVEKDKLGRSDIPSLEIILQIRKDKILKILKGDNNE